MTKQEKLKNLRLLSALESWAMSVSRETLPDYLHESLGDCVMVLERDILGDAEPIPPELTEDEQRRLELGRTIERAYAEIPEGTEISIDLQLGSASVRLFRVGCGVKQFEEKGCLTANINDAIDAATGQGT